MQVTNQRPVILSAIYNHDYTMPFNPTADIKNAIVRQLRQPVIANNPVYIQDDQGNDVTDDQIADMISACCGDSINQSAEDWCKDLFQKTLLHFNPHGINIQMLYMAQALVQSKLPYPSPTMVYTPAADIIPTCREFITGQCGPEKLFANFAAYGQVDTLGVYFVNEVSFNQFKVFFDQQTNALLSQLPPDTQNLIGDFKSLRLQNLSESLLLRNDVSQNNQPKSFARLLLNLLLTYAGTVGPSEYGIMPFRLSELFVPTSVVFINVEKHMHATPKQIKDEWTVIQKSLTTPPPITSNQKLTRLTAGIRAAMKIQAAAVTASNSKTSNRSGFVAFSSRPPKTLDIVKLIQKIMEKMTRVNRSENSYKSVTMTFNKPNRRDPDDFNKMGKSVSTKYRPNLHIYIDTSGSISEDNYKSILMACIIMAKKFNINLYINSFSDTLSQCSLLRTKNRSVKELYAIFQKIPKVTGGTNFDNVWDYINMSPARRRELSIMITDFEYTPKNRRVQHPKNLYYVPCANVMDYKRIVKEAMRFCKKCEHIDPNIRNRILF